MLRFRLPQSETSLHALLPCNRFPSHRISRTSGSGIAVWLRRLNRHWLRRKLLIEQRYSSLASMLFNMLSDVDASSPEKASDSRL